MAGSPIAARRSVLRCGFGSLCFALAVLVLVQLPAPAAGGPPARDDAGNFVTLEVEVSAPGGGKRRHRRGAGIELDYFTANALTDEPPSGEDVVARTEFRMANGFVINHRAFPICRESVLVDRGPSACPRRSRLGTGTALVDPRPLFPVLLTARIELVNSTSGFSPAIAVWGETLYGQAAVYLWEMSPPRGHFGPSFVNPPGSKTVTGPVILDFRRVHLAVARRRVRYRKRWVHYFETKTPCQRGWLFQLVNTQISGEKLAANDRVPCPRG
jgi:hypothetical protein